MGWRERLLGRSNRALTETPPAAPGRIQKATARLAQFVKLPGQKLHDIFAFCEDGKMDYWDHCCCLIAVCSSPVLHQRCDDPACCVRYGKMLNQPGMLAVEGAYSELGDDYAAGVIDSQDLRDRRLLKILRAEMTRRQQPPSLPMTQDTVSIGA